jgi:regulator of sirC expression with transglutaminase-like and TPR domain
MVQSSSRMNIVPEIRAEFIEEVRQADDDINLARAALLIAREEYPKLDVNAYLNVLDDMADDMKGRAGRMEDTLMVVDRMNQLLFEEWGFIGNQQEYYDPRNSFLNQVIDRRMGIPITLSLIYLEVGWRLVLPVAGIGFPGHFLVQVELPEGDVFIDPFNRGRVVSTDHCQEMLRSLYGEETELHPSYFSVVSKRQILSRMLTNLKVIYMKQTDWPRALAVIERLQILEPNDWTQFRDRGLVRSGLHQYAGAYQDLKAYLQQNPQAEDAKLIRQYLAEVRQRLASLN